MELLRFQGHHGASPDDCDVKGCQKLELSAFTTTALGPAPLLGQAVDA